jgi:hypothetical protein
MHKSLQQTCLILILLFTLNNNVFGGDNLPTSTASSEPANPNVANDYTKGILKSDSTFKCAGIGLIDKGMALDREGLFFDLGSQELICTYGMMSKCAVPNEGQSCICPPAKWVDSGCWAKYSEFQRIKSIKDREWYEKNIKK